MAQSKKRPERIQNVSNDQIYPAGFTITYYCETRLDNSVDREDAVGTYVTVDYSGVKFSEGLKIDPTVRFQNSGVKGGYFKSQDEFREWAEANATEDNPHVVHFDKLGSRSQFITKKERAAMIMRQMKAEGVDVTDPDAIAEWFEENS